MATHDYVEADEAHHPGSNTYVKVAIVLAIVTAAEVAVYYIPRLHGAMVPILIALSTFKFLAVVSFFMHLKFDDKLFRSMFAAGMLVSLAVYIALLAMTTNSNYHVPHIVPPAEAAGESAAPATTSEAAPVAAAPAAATEAPAAAAAPTAAQAAAPAAAADTATIKLEDIFFDPKTFSIPANTPVTVELPNDGASPHDFSIDALKISQEVEPGETGKVVINAPAGTYEYYCNIPGHKEAGMVGTLTVK